MKVKITKCADVMNIGCNIGYFLLKRFFRMKFFKKNSVIDSKKVGRLILSSISSPVQTAYGKKVVNPLVRIDLSRDMIGLRKLSQSLVYSIRYAR